jgi:uncharacterized protein DUF2505
MRYTIKHPVHTDVDTFWNKIFFDGEFNNALFVEGLGFTTYEVTEQRTEPSGVITRRVEQLPKVELPAAARRVLGDNTGFTEVGRFDPATKKYTADIIGKVASDKIKTKLEIWLEPRGDKRSERIAQIENTVKIFGLGTLIEGFIEQQTRELYNRGAELTNNWIKARGL